MKKMISLLTALCLMLTLLAGGVSAFAEDAGAYTVLVTDSNGDPVQGAVVQFCSDTECMMVKTDETGIASFEQGPGSYTVHILKVPEGFVPDDTEYTAPETPGQMTLVLRTEGEETDDETDVLEAPEIGFRFEMPESYRSLKGTQNWSASYLDDGILQVNMEYYAVPEEQIDAYMEYKNAYIDAVISGGEEPEAPNPAWSSGSEFAYVFVVHAINGGRGEEELRQSLREYNGYHGDDFSWLEEVGRDGETTFFVGQYAQLEEEAEEYREGMGEFYDEFAALASDRDTFLAALTLTEPQWPRELAVGDTIVCETTDLEGNPVNCGDVFSESKVTMINVWATWCGPCKGELPELAEMAKDFEAQGCRIIGVCMDAEDEQMAELASSILAEAGVEYLNLMASENVSAAFPITAYPTSFFVDSEGKLLLEPVVGANLEGYAEALAEALALVG